MLKIDEVHPGYKFSSDIKKAKYSAILKAYGDEDISLACTFPGLSNYKFERLLIERHPKIRIHCFENDRVTYEEILHSFRKPKEVTLIHSEAEEFLVSSETKYDIIFFDYCGGPHEDISSLIDKHMSDSGVFAMTEFTARGCREKHPPFINDNFKQVIETLRYNSFMEFKAYKKVDSLDGEMVVVEVPDIVSTASDGTRIYVEAKYPVRKTPSSCDWKRSVTTANDLGALQGHFDAAMIDLIDSVLVTGSFVSSASDMNNRRRNYFMKYPYTPQKVAECWGSIKSKLRVLSRLPGYGSFKEIYQKMEVM
jgi:hypothetical protein